MVQSSIDVMVAIDIKDILRQSMAEIENLGPPVSA